MLYYDILYVAVLWRKERERKMVREGGFQLGDGWSRDTSKKDV